MIAELVLFNSLSPKFCNKSVCTLLAMFITLLYFCSANIQG
jgi:hypothetical protein